MSRRQSALVLIAFYGAVVVLLVLVGFALNAMRGDMCADAAPGARPVASWTSPQCRLPDGTVIQP